MGKPVDLEKMRYSLVQTIESAQRKLDAIDIILDDLAKNGPNLSTPSNIIEDDFDDAILSPQFPSHGNAERQMMFIFENAASVALTLGGVKKIYDEYIHQTNGKAKRVDNAVRKLKGKGKLKMIKYNKNNKQSYYGLPSWFGEEDLLDERKPNKTKLPIEITDRDID